MRTARRLIPILALAGGALGACNLPQQDTGAIQTEAALTVQAALTANAPSATATSTTAPFPTLPAVTSTISATDLPTSTCDRAQFVTDVTYPDDTIVAPSASFTKTWRLKNVGSCAWTSSYSLIFVSGESMGGPATQNLLGNVAPGQTVDLSVDLTAPGSNGTYTGNWRLRNAAGVAFSTFYVRIKVQPPVVTTVPSAFAVTSVSYSFSEAPYAGKSDCPMMTAQITTNGAGDVKYKWTRSDGASAPTETVNFASAGTKSVSTNWALGATWEGTEHWLGIYIDEPNNQDFGHLTFTDACDG